MKTAHHTFHIPVMGTGFTIDTPLKVARFGISSVISLVDDKLIEKTRRHYCGIYGKDPAPIADGEPDARARRITAYLNLVDEIVARQIEEVRRSPFEAGSAVTAYFEMLPDESPAKRDYRAMLAAGDPAEKASLQDRLRGQVASGAADVNIMTKLDRERPGSGQKLPREHSDAMAALRGFALSSSSSSMVFSAGMNLHLFGYASEFPDFFPDARGPARKKITLKVSDFRSALTQGKVLAKKGLWVSEYRVESGLNCGGHAFPTAGELLGPLLEEFKRRKEELVDGLFRIYRAALREKRGLSVELPPAVRITAQGGIGTREEDALLRGYYGLDGTGWGTPFLLVPEATTVDEETLQKLAAAGENDVYLSDSSPLGVPFQNLRNSASEEARRRRIALGKPGSPCHNGSLALNHEFPGEPLCTASYAYQKKKIAQLNERGLAPEEFSREYERIVEKSCICRELGDGVLLRYGLNGAEALAPAVCPGPNLVYFSAIVSLREMVDHIYGRNNILRHPSRPHQFLNELRLYVDYLKDRALKSMPRIDDKERAYLSEFKRNLFAGMDYYRELSLHRLKDWMAQTAKFQRGLQELRAELEAFVLSHGAAFSNP